MGQGGHLIVINNTGYDWERISVHSYQMESWDNKFPQIIKNGETHDIYVEWSDAIFKDKSDCKAHTTYRLKGTCFQFSIRARRDKAIHAPHAPGYDMRDIWIDFKKAIGNMDVDRCNRSDGTHDLGWIHNGRMIFNLIKDSRGFYFRPIA